jgi:hypothetical protein
MITLFSTLISFLAGGLPKLLDFFQDRADKKQEMALAQLQTAHELEMRKQGYEAQARVEEIRLDQIQNQTAAQTTQSTIQAQQAEMQALYAHDMSLNEGTSQWVKNFRALVRPIITYGFFFLLVFVDAGLFWYGWSAGTDFKTLADMLWDDETQALFASIIAFHFGGRAFGK